MSAKLVIAISQHDSYPWKEIRKVQERTWIDQNNQECLIVHYTSVMPIFLLKILDKFMEKYRFKRMGGKVVTLLSRVINILVSRNSPDYEYNSTANQLTVHSYSTYFLFGRRNLALFDWFINNTTADFLFQTNTSSYIKTDKLLKLINEIDNDKDVYAGVIINPGIDSFPIVSGAGKLLSRSLVLKILQSRNLLKFNNLEDICLAELIFSLNVRASNLSRIDLPTLDYLENIPTGVICKNFHFRCKSETIPRIDSEIMKLLHSRIIQECNKTNKPDKTDIR